MSFGYHGQEGGGGVWTEVKGYVRRVVVMREGVPISYGSEVLRKGIHLSSLWMVPVVALCSRGFSLWLFGSLLVGLVVVEVLRHRGGVVDRVYHGFFGSLLRAEECVQTGYRVFTGGVYVLLGVVLCVGFFSKGVASTSLCVMIIGDSAAALVGRWYRRSSPLAEGDFSKTLVGFLAFCVFGFGAFCLLQVVGMTWWEWYRGEDLGTEQVLLMGVFVVLCGGSAEYYAERFKIDDNVFVMLVLACAMKTILWVL